MTAPISLFHRLSYSGINIYVEYLIGMLSSVLIARAMSPSDYGSYTYFLWLVMFSTSLVNAGVSTGIIKFVAEARGYKNNDKINAIDAYLRKIQLLKIGIVLFVLFFVFIWNKAFFLPTEAIWLMVFVPFVIYGKILYMYRVSMLKGLEAFRELAFIPIIVSPINLVVVAILYWIGVELQIFLIAYFFTTFLYWWLTRYVIKKLSSSMGSVEIDDNYKNRIKSHLKKAGLSSILGFVVMSQSEIAFLKWFGYEDSVAFFSIAHQLSAAAMLLVPGVYSNILLPLIARSVAQDDKNMSALKVKVSMVYLLQMSLLVAVPVMLFSPVLIDYLYGDKYQTVAYVLVWLIALSVLKSANATATSYLMSVDRQSAILKTTAVFVLVTLFLDIILIWYFGLNGAIAAYGLASVGMVFVMNFLAFYILKSMPLWREIGLSYFCALIAGFVVFLLAIAINEVVPDILIMVFGSILYVMIYIALLLLVGAIRNKEIHALSRYLSGVSGAGRWITPYLNYCITKNN